MSYAKQVKRNISIAIKNDLNKIAIDLHLTFNQVTRRWPTKHTCYTSFTLAGNLQSFCLGVRRKQVLSYCLFLSLEEFNINSINCHYSGETSVGMERNNQIRLHSTKRQYYDSRVNDYAQCLSFNPKNIATSLCIRNGYSLRYGAKAGYCFRFLNVCVMVLTTLSEWIHAHFNFLRFRRNKMGFRQIIPVIKLNALHTERELCTTKQIFTFVWAEGKEEK